MSRDVSCAAQKSLKSSPRKSSCNNPLITPQQQYVGGTGVVVPTSPGAQRFSLCDNSGGQVIQRCTQSALTSNGNFTQGAYGNDPASANRGIKNMSDIVADKAEIASSQNIRISQSGVLYTLHMIREPVVDYQETRGIPRNEEITFVTLVTSLCTQAYTAAITILVMLWNLMPLVDGLVYFVRFFLDKLIDIVQTPDSKDKAIKGAIFFGELTVVTFIIFLIVGLIFMPVYVLMARLFSKVFSMIAW